VDRRVRSFETVARCAACGRDLRLRSRCDFRGNEGRWRWTNSVPWTGSDWCGCWERCRRKLRRTFPLRCWKCSRGRAFVWGHLLDCGSRTDVFGRRVPGFQPSQASSFGFDSIPQYAQQRFRIAGRRT
jgi:hypothetical protein